MCVYILNVKQNITFEARNKYTLCARLCVDQNRLLCIVDNAASWRSRTTSARRSHTSQFHRINTPLAGSTLLQCAPALTLDNKTFLDNFRNERAEKCKEAGEFFLPDGGVHAHAHHRGTRRRLLGERHVKLDDAVQVHRVTLMQLLRHLETTANTTIDLSARIACVQWRF